MDKDSSDLEHECNVCLLTFKEKYNLIKHKASHTGLKTLVCEICGKKLGRVDSYKEHLIIHTGIRHFKCNFCDKDFNNRRYLNVHKKAMHTNTKNFKCDICLQEFNFYVTLKSHILTHTKEKPFACNVCDTSFSTSSYLVGNYIL